MVFIVCLLGWVKTKVIATGRQLGHLNFKLSIKIFLNSIDIFPKR